MSFENAPVPFSMFNENGTMVSTDKSQYLHKLEELLSSEEIALEIQTCNAIIIDGNAVIHMLQMSAGHSKSTFKDMTHAFGQYIKNKSQHISSENYVKHIHI